MASSGRVLGGKGIVYFNRSMRVKLIIWKHLKFQSNAMLCGGDRN